MRTDLNHIPKFLFSIHLQEGVQKEEKKAIQLANTSKTQVNNISKSIQFFKVCNSNSPLKRIVVTYVTTNVLNFYPPKSFFRILVSI